MSAHPVFQGQWTEELDERLRVLAPDYSASQIASMLGASRNAVIGRCSRRKIDLASAATKIQRSPVVRLVLKGAPPRPARPKYFATFNGITDPAKVDQIAAARAVQRESKMTAVETDWRPARIGFMKLRDGLCKWPLWTGRPALDEKFFCGNESLPGLPYCLHCRTLSIAPRATKSLDKHLGIDKLRSAA